MKGKLIVIDGTDGSGKGTQTEMLKERLAKEGINVKTISFPTYGTESCKSVEQYLNGEFGSPEFTGPYFTAMLYAFNRAKEMKTIQKELDEGTHYLVNRYTSANAGHQGGKIRDKQERQQFLDWLFELEFDIFKIPKPDATILLHMPPAIGQQFVGKKKKEERTYLTEGKEKDVHEQDIDHLKDAEQAYLSAAKILSWKVVTCAILDITEEEIGNKSIPPEKKVRTLKEIHEDIYNYVKNLL